MRRIQVGLQCRRAAAAAAGTTSWPAFLNALERPAAASLTKGLDADSKRSLREVVVGINPRGAASLGAGGGASADAAAAADQQQTISFTPSPLLVELSRGTLMLGRPEMQTLLALLRHLRALRRDLLPGLPSVAQALPAAAAAMLAHTAAVSVLHFDCSVVAPHGGDVPRAAPTSPVAPLLAAGTWPAVQHLQLANAEVTASALQAAVARLPSLRHISLHSCRMSFLEDAATLAAALCAPTGLTALEARLPLRDLGACTKVAALGHLTGRWRPVWVGAAARAREGGGRRGGGVQAATCRTQSAACAQQPHAHQFPSPSPGCHMQPGLAALELEYSGSASWLSSLSRLTRLHLGGVTDWGGVQAGVACLPALRQLRLVSRGQDEVQDWRCLQACAGSLQMLRCWCAVLEPSSWPAELPALESLHCCQLPAGSMAWLARCTALGDLRLAGDWDLSQEDATCVLPELRSLHLPGWRRPGQGLATLLLRDSFPQLTSLRTTPSSGELMLPPEALSGARMLEQVVMSGVRYSGPEGWAALGSLSALKSLHLHEGLAKRSAGPSVFMGPVHTQSVLPALVGQLPRFGRLCALELLLHEGGGLQAEQWEGLAAALSACPLLEALRIARGGSDMQLSSQAMASLAALPVLSDAVLDGVAAAPGDWRVLAAAPRLRHLRIGAVTCVGDRAQVQRDTAADLRVQYAGRPLIVETGVLQKKDKRQQSDWLL